MDRNHALLLPAALAFILIAFSCGAQAQPFETLYSFEFEGAQPVGELVEGTDGTLYGVTRVGGKFDRADDLGEPGDGTIFSISPSGGHTVLHHFDGAHGATPFAGLTLANDGNFYGITSAGGANDLGVVYKITPSGDYSVIFECTENLGVSPKCKLAQGADGALYATASFEGPNGGGTVFKVTTSGQATLLHGFANPEGGEPDTGLLLGSDGMFYGVTKFGGSSNNGVIFQMTPAGSLTVLHEFAGSDGSQPDALLIEGSDHALYGVASAGGANGHGAAFRITTNGDFSVLHDFDTATGSTPEARLLEIQAGVFLGATTEGGANGTGCIYRLTTAKDFQVLHDAPASEGSAFTGGLVLASNNTIYGLATNGANSSHGAVYTVTVAGALTLVHSFGQNFGESPNSALIESGGAIYGVTGAGGAFAAGEIYSLASAGTFSVLHSFDGGTGGQHPSSDLLKADDGNYYGVTDQGGVGQGTLYQLTSASAYSVIYAFQGAPDGAAPEAPLVDGHDGFLYGTTSLGGTQDTGIFFKVTTSGTLTTLFEAVGNSVEAGMDSPLFPLEPLNSGPFLGTATGIDGGTFGSLFRIARDGSVTVLHSFDAIQASLSSGPVARDAQGNIYGTTSAGGGSNQGTIFKWSADGQFSLLHQFNAGGDGFQPTSGLIFGPDGALYGASLGGPHGQGVLFKITTSGAFTPMHYFNGADGTAPRFRLLLGDDQKLYGVADGGSGGAGVIFRFDPASTGDNPPIAEDDIAFMPPKPVPLKISVLANDSDPDNDPLVFTSIQDGQFGSVIDNHDGTLTYTPSPIFSFAGEDSFIYAIGDGRGGEAAAIVRIEPSSFFAGVFSDVLLDASQSAIGLTRISVSKSGSFSGQLRLQDATYSFRGRFYLAGHAVIQIKRPKTTPLTLTLDHSAFEVPIITGLLAVDGADYHFTLRVLENSLAIPPRPGGYTMLLQPEPDTTGNAAFSQGIGYGFAKLGRTGTVKITGKLGDGTPISVGTAVRADGAIPIYATVYGKPKGRIGGLPTIPYQSDRQFTGTLDWVKPPHAKDARYAAGFSTTVTLDAGYYFAPNTPRDFNDPPETTRVLGDLDPSGNATLTFAGGIFASPLAIDVNVSTKNKVTPAGALLSLKFTASNGAFTVVVKNPQTGKKITAKGVVQQLDHEGAGLFLESTDSGSVVLTAKP